MNYKSNCFYRNSKMFCYSAKRNFYLKTYVAAKKKYSFGKYSITIHIEKSIVIRQ